PTREGCAMKASRPVHSQRQRSTPHRAPVRHPARRSGGPPLRPGLFSGPFAFVLLALAVCGLFAAIALVSGNVPSGAASGALGLCGGSDVSPCDARADWIALRSTASGDIIAAARSSTLFREQRTGNGAQLQDLSRLGTPLLVQPLRPSTRVGGQIVVYPDFYVIPILKAA